MHPKNQIVFYSTVTPGINEIEAELDMLFDASAPCLEGYTTSVVVEGETTTLYVVAYVTDIMEFMRRISGVPVLLNALV